MRRTWLLFSQAVTIAVAVLFVLATLKPEWLGQASRGALPLPSVTVAATPAAASAPAAGFRLAAGRASPAVVSVITGQTLRGLDPGFHRFLGSEPTQTGLGSGVIVAPEGYVLTNHHVVKGADSIEVRLADGRQATATLVGVDPDTDLAVLKLELPALPVVSLGDAAALRVGDPVLAIGNPFNVGQTVTAGIVSALGRTPGLSTYENFIQTDAAINPGNSGGALVDAEGHLVGINTAIFSRSGGYQGIGFAVPSNLARRVVDDLKQYGKVRRGTIGAMELSPLTSRLASEIGTTATEGFVVMRMARGPAYQAGLRPGDVILSFNGKPLTDTAAFMRAIADTPIGQALSLEILRESTRRTLKVPVQEEVSLPRQR